MQPVTRSRPPEHPLLGTPRRDVITTCVLSLATAVLFVLMAFSGPRAAIQRVDNRWLRLMLDVRSGPLTERGDRVSQRGWERFVLRRGQLDQEQRVPAAAGVQRGFSVSATLPYEEPGP